MPCDRVRAALAAFCMAIFLASSAPAGPPPQPRRDPLENNIDRWNRMSPEQRERELAKLPPARARLIRQRLRRYNQMNPEEQQTLRERYQTFSQLPPAKQQMVRDRLREFRQLPAERRPVVHREVEQLRLMPDSQREAHLNSEEFRSRYSPQEQQIIRDLTEYLEPPK